MPKKQAEGTYSATPEFLAKRGIASVTDNLKPEDQLRCARSFLLIFKTELQALLAKSSQKLNDKED
jgi:hypothetical protein